MPAARPARMTTLLVAPLALLALTSLALTTPALARTITARQAASPASPGAATAVAGYLWSTSQNASQPVDSYYAFNSTGGAVTLTNPATGQYVVTFAGLGSVAGKAIVQASTYDGTDTCAVGGWSPAGANLQASVDCFSVPGAAPANTLFDLTVTRPVSPPHGTFDYSFVYLSSGRLTAYQYNSSHKENSVTNPTVGHYVVTLGGPSTSGTHGVVMVTGYGNAAGNCQTTGWRGSATGEIVNVNCRNSAGHFANREFMVTYAAANNLMGLNGKVTANAFVTARPGVYQPADQYDSVSGARVTVTHVNPGYYFVAFGGSRSTHSGGHIEVNAVGSTNRLCLTGGWGGSITPTTYVYCYDNAGHQADSNFVVNWVVG